MRFLSPEWIQAEGVSMADPVDGAFTGRVKHTVTGAPGGDVVYVVAWTDGRPTEGEVGGEAEVALVIPYAEAVSVARGDGDLNALFMQGQMKVSGPTGPLLAFLAASQRAPIVDGRRARAEVTDFG